MSEEKTELLVTGGQFLLGPITATMYLLGYRDASGRAWDYRTPELDSVDVNFDACAGTLSLVAKPRFNFGVEGKRGELHLNISADPTSFSDPLYFPTTNGFSNDPGCVESYRASAKIEIIEDGNIVSTETIELSALEFGGAYTCKSTQ